jgi:hypothetical protein
MGLPSGLHRGRPLGSRLAMPYARDSLANYLTEGTREVVRKEVVEAPAGSEKLFHEPRIFEDLLSSQPLCFNLFGELARDLTLASATLSTLLGVSGVEVKEVAFEHSPGRGDPRFTADRSAFDVFMRYETARGEPCFVGMEVKYVEDLAAAPARHRQRYDELADAMEVFRDDAREKLRAPPLEQFWRDHLLAGSLRLHDDSFAAGSFAVVYPSENEAVASGVRDYRACLRDDATFKPWTIERVLVALADAGAGPWVEELRARYLGASTTEAHGTVIRV